MREVQEAEFVKICRAAGGQTWSDKGRLYTIHPPYEEHAPGGEIVWMEVD